MGQWHTTGTQAISCGWLQTQRCTSRWGHDCWMQVDARYQELENLTELTSKDVLSTPTQIFLTQVQHLGQRLSLSPVRAKQIHKHPELFAST